MVLLFMIKDFDPSFVRFCVKTDPLACPKYFRDFVMMTEAMVCMQVDDECIELLADSWVTSTREIARREAL